MSEFIHMESWVGVDLDGTLAFYDSWKGHGVIGDPIPAMLLRVKQLLADGVRVKIFTARMSHNPEETTKTVQDWTEKHLGVRLEVTNVKDFGMVALYDDRAIQVEENTGRIIK